MLTKRAVLAAFPLALTLTMPRPSRTLAATPSQRVATGADALSASGFADLAGKRVGLITNQTGLIGNVHLADALHTAADVKLTAILAPEHGFRGSVEAGKRVGDAVDPATGVPVFSLYGASKKPSPAMLRNIEVLVFDIQDIGARFYTFISTMGLAMQAAAEARIPFIVLDRPNPLGGDYVSGFTLEPKLLSFVGQYQIPIVHGLTVGELARMIKGEKLLAGLDMLDLRIIEMKGWERSMRWPQTERGWVPTSPNIPTFESALVYPGIGIAGELDINEGRGTPTPFSLVGAPWFDGARLSAKLNAFALPGVKFEPETYTPRPIPSVAATPRFSGKSLHGMRVGVTDVAAIEPLEMGMHVLSALVAEAHAKRVERLFPNLAMFHALAGTKRLHGMLTGGSDGAAIVAAWQPDVAKFKDHRARYLLY
jgi:uncharacterized protein YbbC (DUF1343 family)